MRWPWRRQPEPERPRWAGPPAPIPDYDTIFPDGRRRWGDLIDTSQVSEADLPVPDPRDLSWLNEPTRALPVLRAGPLPMTPGQRWRSRGSRS
ncbi:MAG TPA: hypothetical protein VF062_06465 [Candidatus Limnocylindrales bacterium]